MLCAFSMLKQEMVCNVVNSFMQLCIRTMLYIFLLDSMYAFRFYSTLHFTILYTLMHCSEMQFGSFRLLVKSLFRRIERHESLFIYDVDLDSYLYTFDFPIQSVTILS